MKAERDLRLLVTAVGGDLGQAMVKALRLGLPAAEVWGCDAGEKQLGGWLVDRFVALPSARDPGYLAALDGQCREADIQAVLPASEVEIQVLGELARQGRLPSGAVVVAQPADVVSVLGDKLSCLQCLEGVVPLAPYADGEDPQAVRALVAKAGFPLVVKSRRASGSKSVVVVSGEPDLQQALRDLSSPLVQGFIDDGQGEYSCGLFGDDDRLDVVCFRRELGPVGCTWYAELCEAPAVADYVRAIGSTLGIRGSLNVQVRHSAHGVRLLEINPRFSSLAAARAAAGFNDVCWSVLQALGGPVPPLAGVRPLRFQRYFAEVIDVGQGFKPLDTALKQD